MNRTLFVAVLLLQPLALLPGQQPEATSSLLPAARPAPALATGVPIHDEGVDPVHGALGVWAAGATYKCGFADGAFTFVPYLGEQAPHNLPWQWRTTAVRLGELDLLGDGEPHERHGDWQFVRERGLVAEIWDVRAHGAEQSFRITAPPDAAAGDLRVRGRITTPLQASPRAPAVAALRFCDPASGYELVYGTATAFDAAGRACPVPASFDGEEITLQVPAAFVATASWPLHIDPLLQPYGIVSGSATSFQDLDLDAIPGTGPSHQLAMVWARAASAADSDLFVFRANADFTGGMLFASELSTTVSSREGSVAGSWIDGSMTVAWSRRSGSTVRCYARPFAADGPNGSLANGSLLPSPTGGNEWRPRVSTAKVSDLIPSQALIVRLREVNGATELWGTLFGTATAQSYGSMQIAGPTLYVGDIAEPWVAKNLTGSYEAWLVAYQFWHPINARWTVAVKRINYIGQVDSQALTMDGPNPARHTMRPRIDGSGGRYLVAFTSAPTASYPGQLTSWGGTAIETQRIDWEANSGPTQPWPRQTIATSPGRSLNTDGIACSTSNRAHWLVTVRSGSSSRAALLGYRGAVVDEDVLPGPTGTGTHVAQGVAAAYEPLSDQFPVLHTHTTSASGNVTWSCTGSTRTYPAQPDPQPYGAACNLPTPNTYGDFRIGTDRSVVGVSGLAPTAWVLAGLSLAPASYPFANLGLGGGCTLLLDLAAPNWLGTIATTANGAGFAGIVVPLPETLPPLDLHVQFVAAGTLPGTFRASRGLTLAVR